jgi:endoglucanase
MWEQLEKLSNAFGAAGYESAAAEIAAEYLKPFVDEVKTDKLGNVIGIKTVDPNAETLLLDAHIDEIGIMITGQTDEHLPNGFLKFITLGGIDPRMLMAREFKLNTGHYGVVACLPPHVQATADLEKCVPTDELFLDTGLDDASVIPVGTVGVFFGDFFDSGNCIVGKALDDRACFMVILRALELVKKLKINIIVVGSVQEEVGIRGAKVAGYSLAPDYCVAIDVTHGYTPDAPKDRTFKVGGGPCIGVGPNMARFLSDKLKKIAVKKNIPYQIEVLGGNTSTNGWSYATTRDGVPTTELCLPLKYMHSPVEMITKDDFENTAKLLAAFIDNWYTQPPPSADGTPSALGNINNGAGG